MPTRLVVDGDDSWFENEPALDAESELEAAGEVADRDAEINKLIEVLAERGCDGVVRECAMLEARVAELEAESEAWEKSSVAALVARRKEQDHRISMLETELGRARDIIDRAVQRSQHFQELAKTLGEQRDALLAVCKTLVTAEDAGDLAMVEKAARMARVALGKEMSSE
jgi:hypothetical protein